MILIWRLQNFWVLRPPLPHPLSTFGSDVKYWIHTTSHTLSTWPLTPPPGAYKDHPLSQIKNVGDNGAKGWKIRNCAFSASTICFLESLRGNILEKIRKLPFGVTHDQGRIWRGPKLQILLALRTRSETVNFYVFCPITDKDGNITVLVKLPQCKTFACL